MKKQLKYFMQQYSGSNLTLMDDRMLEDYTFHAKFIEEPLEEVLKLLSITTPVSYLVGNEGKRSCEIF